MIRTIILSTCALAMTTAATADAGSFRPAQVPATADVVIHFDVDEFNRSKLHRMFKGEIAKATRELDAALAKEGLPIRAADLLSVSDVTFWADGTDPDRGAMIANGVDARRLLKAVTKLPNFRVARHRGYVLSRIDVDGDDTYIGAMRRALVISDDKDAVARTLDAMTKKVATLAGSATARQMSKRGGMLVAGAFGSAVAQKIRKQAGSPMFKNIDLKGGAVFARESGNSLAIRAVLEHASATGARALVQLGQAGLTMASMGSNDPDLQTLTKNINLSSSGTKATIDIRVPYRLLRKLSKGQITL